MTKIIHPHFNGTAFNCPSCGAYAKQRWYYTAKANIISNAIINSSHSHSYSGVLANNYLVQCDHCNKYSFWHSDKMIFPYSGTAPLPNVDLPEDVKEDYNEARNIIELSPRGSVALLRLAIQKLCVHLGEEGKNINTDIGNLVNKGLPPKMQKALDSVRVIGNNAVHPGVIDLKDDIETARKLFAFVNIIADVMITQPNEIDKFYEETIPENSKNAIDKRDNN
ncbi:DUF4145 domain-containing protein [Tenacibaculum aiptasiae]|uniref:DUF4145 domain-containing protein n=1 Tax=Tenacibaculum aiptasiae TaxID=426481 RepID=UPI00232F1DCF|nr:DUF4145 domain-containing protein [Tenacibaculum aiptasiae]